MGLSLNLDDLTPFGRGGKRECFIHPDDPSLCIKLNRPDRLPADLHRAAPLWRRLRKSVRDMDENHQDWSALSSISYPASAPIWNHVPRCHGWVDTSRGRGLVVDLVRDFDGLISRSFLDLLWHEGYGPAAKAAVDELVSAWSTHTVPSRSLGLHNMAARRLADGSLRLVVIDGLGDPLFFPVSARCRWYALRLARSRAREVRTDIDTLINRKTAGLSPGPLGFLLSRS